MEIKIKQLINTTSHSSRIAIFKNVDNKQVREDVDKLQPSYINS